MTEASAKSKRGYHHGNLKEALVKATLMLIEEKGPTGFTLSEAARQAGVSAAAPYRHYKGREDLIADVAFRGFSVFTTWLESAWNGGKPNPLSAFMAVGKAYLEFAQKHPGHYIAMFESGVSVAGNSELAHAADRAMSVLTDAARELSAHLPPQDRPPATMVAHHIWAMSHGIVELFARGAPGSRAPYSPEDLLESGTTVYLKGLGLI